jgi:hypothetical protein
MNCGALKVKEMMKFGLVFNMGLVFKMGLVFNLLGSTLVT